MQMPRKMFSFAAAGLMALCFTQLAAAQMLQTPEARAREAVEWVLHGDYQTFLANSEEAMQKAAPLEAWQKQIGPMLTSFGKLESLGEPKSQKAGPNTVVALPAKFEKQAIDFTVAVAPDGRIAGFLLRLATPKTVYARPSYSKPDSFVEREVTVGSGEWQLPGTLLVPKSAAPAPAVVLVHGSGPNDRNETILGNEPFRDLAEGLASRGVAVLRYDKRTKVYGVQMAQMKDLTVREETVEDAARAVDLLRDQPGIDPKRVYVLGHSLGGYLLPMILSQSPKAAGGIALAGSTRPLEDLVLEQMEYLIPIQTAGSEEAKKEGQKKLDETRQTVAAIKALQPGKEPSGVDSPSLIGMSAHYLLALRGYNPPAVAAGLHRPLLILQGERDYQVTMQDFGNWKAALGDRKNVTLKSYPALNHLFMEGAGKSTPHEYASAGHVSASVIDDVARWVLAQ
jgi:dienelactone hydrolase